MNLPRHNISSHAPAPVFVNAHFASVPVQALYKDGQSSGVGGGVPLQTSSRHSSSKQRRGTSDARGGQAGPSVSSPHGGDTRQAKGGLDGDSSGRGDSMIAFATREGFFVAHADPFTIVARRDFPAMQGGLSHAALIDDSSLMVLVGGGRVPRFAPNKVILWDENAEVKIAVKRRSTSAHDGHETAGLVDEASGKAGHSDEETASPAPSTIFSVGREQEHADTSDLGGEEAEAVAVAEDMEESASQVLRMSSTSDDMTGSIRPLLQDSTQSLQASASQEGRTTQSMSASLSASSANMDDPFAATSPPLSEEESRPKVESPRPTARDVPPTSVIEEVPTAEQEGPPTALGQGAPAESSTSSPSVPQTNEPQYRLVRGREVAELEFGEAVESIAVETFTVTQSADIGDPGDDVRVIKVTLLIVSLQRKAVIFEMGAHLVDKLAPTAAPTSASWSIRQRMVVQCHASSSRCSPSMAAIKGTNCALIAIPGRQSGHVQLISLAFSQTARTSIGSSIAGASTIIAAHSNPMACMALSHDARLLCTASERGTLLRVWSTLGHRSKTSAAQQINVVLQGELRRGTDAAGILSMAWTPDNKMLAAASDKGTVHFFAVDALQHGQPSTASTSTTPTTASSSPRSRNPSGAFTLSRQANRYLPSALQQFAQSLPASFVPTYFRSQWSFAQFKITLRVFSGRSRDGLKYVKPPPPSRKRGAQQRPRQTQPLAGAAQRVEGPAPTSLGRSVENDDDDDDDDDEAFESIGDAIIPDRARNLEGGWASLRGRVHDIRRGERTIEESIWLAWVPARPASSRLAAPATGSSSPAAATTKHNKDSAASTGALPYHLVAVTSAGGHYRLAVSRDAGLGSSPMSSSSASASPPPATVLNMYKHDSRGGSSSQDDAQAGGSCWLVEYTPFGMRDEWLE